MPENFLSALQSGMDFGQNVRAKLDRDRLASLAGKAYAAPAGQRDAIIADAITTDPNAGFGLAQGLNKTDDARDETMFNMARVLSNAPESARPGLWQSMVPRLKQFGMTDVPDAYTPETAPTIMGATNSIVQASLGVKGQPNDVREFEAMARAAGLTPGSPEYQEAADIALGRKPRAVTGATKFGTFTGADGKPRPTRGDPSTKDYEIYYDETGQWVPLGAPSGGAGGGGGSAALDGTDNGGGFTAGAGADKTRVNIDGIRPDRQEQLARAVAAMSQAGMSEDDINAVAGNFLQQTQDVAPATPGARGLGVGRSAEEQAAATTAATEAAKLPFDAKRLQMETDAAVARTTATTAATTAASRANDQRDKDSALRVYEAATQGLRESLQGATTGPIVGRLPALTSGQQIAEGGVSAMAPVLKQLFRTAGEGTFTDKDQDLLMRMIPTRQDLEEARDAKLANIDRIVRAKLAPAPAPTAPAPITTPRERGNAVGGARVRVFNPKTGRLE